MPEPQTLTIAFMQECSGDAANALSGIDNANIAAFFADIPGRILAPVIGQMANWKAAAVLDLLDNDKAASILIHCSYEDAYSIVGTMRAETRDAVLGALPSSLATQIRSAMQYPLGTVGALMDPSVPMISIDASTADGLDLLRQSLLPEIQHIFVYSDEKRFEGIVSASELLRASSSVSISRITDRSAKPLSNRSTLTSVSDDPSWDSLPLRPVIGRNRMLVGGLARRVLRHEMDRSSRTAMSSGGESIAVQVFGMYVHSCQGLFGIFAGRSVSRMIVNDEEVSHDR